MQTVRPKWTAYLGYFLFFTNAHLCRSSNFPLQNFLAIFIYVKNVILPCPVPNHHPISTTSLHKLLAYL